MNPMTYPKDIFFDIETLVNVAQPASILLLGGIDAHFLDAYIEQKALLGQPCSVTHIDRSELATLQNFEQRFDVGIAVDLFEHMSKREGALVLSKLRDQLTSQFCAGMPISRLASEGYWQLTELFGLALKKVASYPVENMPEDTQYSLFKYNIDDYKNTPDWLNANNWANPQMWSKYRW